MSKIILLDWSERAVAEKKSFSNFSVGTIQFLGICNLTTKFKKTPFLPKNSHFEFNKLSLINDLVNDRFQIHRPFQRYRHHLIDRFSLWPPNCGSPKWQTRPWREGTNQTINKTPTLCSKESSGWRRSIPDLRALFVLVNFTFEYNKGLIMIIGIYLLPTVFGHRVCTLLPPSGNFVHPITDLTFIMSKASRTHYNSRVLR